MMTDEGVPDKNNDSKSPAKTEDREEKRHRRRSDSEDSIDRKSRRRHRSRSHSKDRYRRDDSKDRRDRDRRYDRDRRDRDGGRDRESRRDGRDYRRNRSRSRDDYDDRERRRDRDRDTERHNGRERDYKPRPTEELEAEREQYRQKREIDDLTKDQRTIFVSQLTKKVTESNLESFFGQIGRVKNIIMLRDKQSGFHKGFAYVEMADLDSIPNCLLFNNVVPDFQKFAILVKASEAEKNFLAKQEPSVVARTQLQNDESSTAATAPIDDPESRVYVGNIHVSIDENAIRTVLEQFGPTESIKLHRDHLGNSKGFAFVKFSTVDSAVLCMNTLAGTELAGRTLKVGPVIDNRTTPAHHQIYMDQQQKQAENTAAKTAATAANVSVAPDGSGNTTGNWKLDADEGRAGLALDSNSRAMLMAKLGQSAGLQVPVPVQTAATASVGQLPDVASTQVAQGASVVPPVGGLPSQYLLVCNLFDPATETDPDWDLDIQEDVTEECAKFGKLLEIKVEKVKPGGMVILKFDSVVAAKQTATAMNGRFFAGRMVTATFLDELLYHELRK